MIVLVIPDLHAPYHHPDALDHIADVKREWKPDEVVCLGDEADRHRLSTHAQESDCHDAETEFQLAKVFLTDLAKLCRTLKLCTSNHVERRDKAANRANFARSELKDWASALGAPSTWRWASEWVIGSVCYFHGTELKGPNPGRQAVNLKRSNVVHGHLHTRATVEWFKTDGWMNFVMSTGWLGDPTSPANRYSRDRVNRPVEGCGIVYNNAPMFIPLSR